MCKCDAQPKATFGIYFDRKKWFLRKKASVKWENNIDQKESGLLENCFHTYPLAYEIESKHMMEN